MRSVLFVCVGNACRSQMAEGFARALADFPLCVASDGASIDWGIPDPRGKGISEFRRVRDIIRDKVEELLERIVKEEQ